MRVPRRRAGVVRACLLVLGCSALVASSPGARADGPAPAKPAVPAAPGADQAKPAEEPPKTVEFLAPDLVKRPDGMLVRYYRVKYVSPAVLVTELDVWKSAKAAIVESGQKYVPAQPLTSLPGQPQRPQSQLKDITNILRITETEENWPVLERMLKVLDVPQPQVRIEAKILELTWDDEIRIGVTSTITKPAGNTFLQSIEAKFPNPIDAVNGATGTFRRAQSLLVFDYALEAVQQGATAKVESRPSILVSQGEIAILRSGDEEPYVQQNLSGNNVTTTTTFKPVGVRLEVQPLLVGDGAVRVRVAAESSRVSDFRVTATSANQQVVNAVISTRNADTVVTVPDGQTLVIGGLEQTTKRDQQTGIPFLQKIPLLGYLFGSTTKRDQKTELYFYVTISVETPEEGRQFVPPGERARLEEMRKGSSGE